MSREAEQGLRYAAQLTAGRFAAQLVLVVSAFAIPRVMGAESYGQYVAWMAMIAILRSASALGLPMVELRFLAPLWRLGKRAQALTLGSTIWTVKVAVAGAGGVAAAVWLKLSPRLAGELELALLLGLLALLNYVHEATISFFLPFGRAGTLASFTFARALLTLVVVVLCFPRGGLEGVAMGLAALYGGLFALSRVILRRIAPLALTGFHWPSLAPHAAFSLAVYVGSVAWMVQGQFSIYAVANWGTREEAAYLGLTLQFYGFLQLLFFSARRGLTPVLSQMRATGQSERLRFWGGLMMRYTVAASCLAAFAWAMLGNEVIRVFLTPVFSPVHKSGTIILVCVLFYCCAESCNILLYVEGRARSAAANTVVYAALTIAGVFLALGGASAGMVYRVSSVYALSSLVYFACSYLTLGFAGRMWLPLRRSLLLALPVVAVVAGFVGQPTLPVRLAALVGFVVLYGGFAVGLGLLPWREVGEILDTVRRRRGA